MATERIPMRHLKEILRQRWSLHRSFRDIAVSCGVSVGAAAKTVSRAELIGLDWPTAENISEADLEQKLYGRRDKRGPERPLPVWSTIHKERSRPGVTLELLHLEYLEQQPGGYGYTSFCNFYRDWLKQSRLSMRQVHKAGEKLFVDYSGKKLSLKDPSTGLLLPVELFVAVLGASNFTYAEASLTQKSEDFIASHIRVFEYMGGVPALLVPDQLKSAVTGPHWYEPISQRTYEEMARHYGAAICPARPAHPKDKAKVEVAVQIVQRWIVARLRHETFFSLDALNDRIAELLEELNARTMKQYKASRKELFEKLDRPALLPLRTERFVHAIWKKARVNIDYHVELLNHYYSVPYRLIHELVEIRYTHSTVEVLHKGERIASHKRNDHLGRHTTVSEHMPKAHQKHLEWTPSRLIHWAGTIGPQTRALVEAILADRPHPEMGYRSCLGILRLAKRDGNDRLEAACKRAMAVKARSFRHIDSILKNGLDRVPLLATTPQGVVIDHENIRGQNYYH